MDVLEEGEVMTALEMQRQPPQHQPPPPPSPGPPKVHPGAAVQQRKTRVLPRCALLSDFDILEKIGEGTFGEVYKAKQRKTGKTVALKKILSRAEQEGFPITAIREIKLLKHLKHQNVIDLLDMAVQYSGETVTGVYMVFIFMDHDLTGLLANTEATFALPQIKCYMLQLLRGLEYLHSQGILHRDVKGSNLLVNNRGELRVTDFGLARPLEEGRCRYTPGVVTRWYRPPELLLGATDYGPSVDMWGAGCILAEMLKGGPLFPGQGDYEQLEMIAKLAETPSRDNMPDPSKYPLLEKIKLPLFKRRIRDEFRGIEGDLIDKLLVLDPAKRLTASEALRHEFFTSPPLPASPKDLPAYQSSHEYTKRDPFAVEEKSEGRHRPPPVHPPHPTPHQPARDNGHQCSIHDSDHDQRHGPPRSRHHHHPHPSHHHRRYDSYDERRSPRKRSRSPPPHAAHSSSSSKGYNPHGRQLSSYADMYDDDKDNDNDPERKHDRDHRGRDDRWRRIN